MSDALPPLPPRPDDGHKGTFGTVMVIGGQAAPPRVMLGGPALSAIGALRVGCGLAILAVPQPLMVAALTIAPSATGVALPVDRKRNLMPSACAEVIDQYRNGCRCLAIGPGLGDGEPQQQVVARLIADPDIPLVIDADALNCLAHMPRFDSDLRAPAVLTPHPGEYARLARALDLHTDPTDPEARTEAAQTLARRIGCVVVLKGQRTVIASGIETHVNETGNVALATAGTGDVLTGVIAGLIAQHFKPSLGSTGRQITPQQQGGLSMFQCATLGVHLHGLAADRWAQRTKSSAGLTAIDLAHELPAALAMYAERG